jgi:hypothetical protein
MKLTLERANLSTTLSWTECFETRRVKWNIIGKMWGRRQAEEKFRRSCGGNKQNQQCCKDFFHMPGILRWWLAFVWSLKWPSINKATPQAFWQLSRKKLDAVVHTSNTVSYAGSYCPSVQITNREKTARNSHRDAPLRDTPVKTGGFIQEEKCICI